MPPTPSNGQHIQRSRTSVLERSKSLGALDGGARLTSAPAQILPLVSQRRVSSKQSNYRPSNEHFPRPSLNLNLNMGCIESDLQRRSPAAMFRTPQAAAPHGLGKERYSPVKSAAMAALMMPSPNEIRCMTPTSAWRARTLAGLSSLPPSRSGSKEQTVMDPSLWRSGGGSRPGSRGSSRSGSRADSKEQTSNALPSLGPGRGGHVMHDLVADPLSPARAAELAMAKADSSARSPRSEYDVEDVASPSQKVMSRRTVLQRRQRLQALLPDAQEVLDRLRGGSEGFSDSEKQRVGATFLRFRVPDSHDVHKEDLCAILKHLGYVHVEQSIVEGIATKISEYATMEYNDFMDFMGRYSVHEQEQFRKKFDEFDEDGNGELDIEEIIKYVSHLGYTPLRSTICEVMDLVDINGDGALQFEELVLLMHLYRHSEGFSRMEVQKLTLSFQDQHAEAGQDVGGSTPSGEGGIKLPAGRLSNVLTTFFGPAFAQDAMQLGTELFDRAKGYDEGGAAAAPPLGLDLSEVLIWARRMRDKEFDTYKQAFKEADEDGSGGIDMGELQLLLVKLGFTITQDAIVEMITIARSRGHWHELEDGSLDYNAFVHFMQVLNEKDGFTATELDEIRFVFEKFDADGSGDIDCIELSDIMHYCGYRTAIEEVMMLLGRIDYNNSGTLDYRQFIRFMRLHNEGEVRLIKDTFDNYKDDDGTLDQDAAREALMDLASSSKGIAGKSSEGAQREEAIVKALDIQNMHIDAPVDTEAFIKLADLIRSRRVLELRKRAGFSDVEIERFHELFNEHDTHGSGCINQEQTSRLVTNLGFPLHTHEDQQRLVQQINEARKTAAECGMPSTSEGGAIDFWIVVQLLRGTYRRDDKQTLDKVTRAAEQSRFKQQEVLEFQEVFLNWHERDHSRFANGHDDGTAADDGAKNLSKSSVLRLLRSLGLKVESPDRVNLDKKLTEMSHLPSGNIDFSDFLRLMRWVLDTNFCNVGKVAAAPSG